MNRRQLAFVLLLNALISLAIALGVVWAIEARRPDPEELAVRYTPPAAVNSGAEAPVAPSRPVTNTETAAEAAAPPVVVETTTSIPIDGAPAATGDEEV